MLPPSPKFSSLACMPCAILSSSVWLGTRTITGFQSSDLGRQLTLSSLERRLFGVGLPESGEEVKEGHVGIPLQAGMEEGQVNM